MILERYKTMKTERLEQRYVGNYNNDFLNDFLVGIHQEDFVLIASETGTGKSEFAYDLAFHNSKKMNVHLFALEADKNEPHNRMVYKLIADDYYRHREGRGNLEMSYRNFLSQKIDVSPYEDAAWEKMSQYDKLHVHYREGGQFDIVNLTQEVGKIRNNCDMIILDHVDYFDLTGPENENSQMTEIMKTLRDINQVYRIPVIVISHLRKKNNRKVVMPSIDDLHGSSNKAKIAKTVILFAKNYEQQDYVNGFSPTYCYVAKSRLGGTGILVGNLTYAVRRNRYNPGYTLGLIKNHGEKVEDLPFEQYPKWAEFAVKKQQEERVGKDQMS